MTTATRVTGYDDYIPIPTARTTRSGLDLIAVERAVNGERPQTMTDPELAYAAQVLSEHNIPRDEASRRLLLPDYVLRRCKETEWKHEVITAWRERSRKRAGLT